MRILRYHDIYNGQVWSLWNMMSSLYACESARSLIHIVDGLVSFSLYNLCPNWGCHNGYVCQQRVWFLQDKCKQYNEEIRDLLREDTVDFLIDQHGYVQGYRPPHILADLLQKNQQPEEERILTDIIIRTKYNLWCFYVYPGFCVRVHAVSQACNGLSGI